MPSEDGSDLVAMLASEVAKQVPVREALEPAADEIGKLGSDLVKCLRLALAPVQYMAVQQDRFRRFIETSAQRVPEDRRIEPIPQILGPVLEGIRYEPEGSLVDEAFSRLLSRAFDHERVGQAHPSFPALIRSLSDDEINIIKQISTKSSYHVRVLSEYAGMDVTFEIIGKQGFPQLKQPLFFETYINRLTLLGLLQGADSGVNHPKPDHWETTYSWKLSQFGRLLADAALTD